MDGGDTTSAKHAATWAAANAEVLRLRLAAIAEKVGKSAAVGGVQNSLFDILVGQMSSPPAYQQIALNFGLTDEERDALLLIGLSDQTPGLAAPLQAHPLANQGRATPALFEKLGFRVDILAPNAPLRRLRLIEIAETGRFYERALSLPEPVSEALQGRLTLDTLVAPLQVLTPMADGSADQAATIAKAWANAVQGQIFFGDAPQINEQIATVVLALSGHGLLCIAAEFLPDAPSERAELALRLRRDLVLTQQVCVILPAPNSTVMWDFAERVGLPLFLFASNPPTRLHPPPLRLPAPTLALTAWQHVLDPQTLALPDVAAATQIPLTAPQLRRAVHSFAAGLAPSLHAAARSEVGAMMGELAQPLRGQSAWEDLILPPGQAAALNQMATFLQSRTQVNETWGFAAKSSRGLGMAALFHGASGTGKTTAAEALVGRMQAAGGAQVPLYRVNVAALVSKYIGETAKNFAQVFQAGEAMGAALLFDEAEGLFGQRSAQIKDSNDKHSNAELGFLLQCLESYPGIAILTTNMRAAIDQAFFRRFRFVIEFSFPDADLREQIWRRVLPDAMPRGDLDFAALARPSLSGGNIRSVALNAAYLAAADQTVLQMHHLAHALRLECSKLERPIPERELKGWGA